jgi:hypothetical protein
MIPTQGIGEHINIEAKDKYIFGVTSMISSSLA